MAAISEASLARRTSGGAVLSSRDVWIWLFLVPTIVLFGAYTVYPIIASYWYSFIEWSGTSASMIASTNSR